MSFQRRCVYLPAVDSPASAKFLRVRRAAANVRHSTKSNDTHSQSSEFPLLQNSVARGGILVQVVRSGERQSFDAQPTL